MLLDDLISQARVHCRKSGNPDPAGKCVVYWMQRSQRGIDNAALTLAVEIANRLGVPCVAYFAPVPFYPRANARHYAFLQQGIGDIRREVEARNVGFVLRRLPVLVWFSPRSPCSRLRHVCQGAFPGSPLQG